VDLIYGPEHRAFRDDVRAFIATNRHRAPKFQASGLRSGSDALAWQALLLQHGYAARTIPKQYGGFGAAPDPLKTRIIAEEFADAGVPPSLAGIGISMLVPTLLEKGTEEQKQKWIAPTLRGEVVWCQGYSEPNAGSDLASLTTRAAVDGDHFVINGQKIWTSGAHSANWVFVLCRTDPSVPKHAGITFVLCPMDQPGVEIRPIVQLTGTSEFNEVFFDGARTSRGNVVGEVDGGWRVAMGTLSFERGVATLAQQIGFERELAGVVATARETGRVEEPVLRDRLVEAWIGLRLLRFNALRTLASDGEPGPEASVAKLAWATWHRALGELAVDVQGPAGVAAGDEGAEALFLFTRADTIYGGSNEVQRNVIAERSLGLPR
jgi:alkylation response protein AidB-like acyl-CoA dehydrogenase